MRSRLSRLLPVLGLASAGILAACSGAAPAPEAAGTEILAAAHGQPLSGPSQAGPTTIVAEVLRAHGSAAHAGRLRVGSEARAARTGLTHVRLEQEIDGLRVYGAYAKVALTDKGHAMHLIARLAPEGAPLAAVRIDARDALRAALVHLGYAASDALTATERGGNMTRFARGAVFHREPTAEQVVFIDDAGGLRKGFLVETWSAARNQLDHTLVDGSGAVVSVERRTNNDRYNVFVEDPLKGAQAVVNGPGAGNAESPSGWLGTGAQTTVNITGNNAHAYLDADANNAADSGGSAVSNGDFLTAVNLTQAPSTASNRSVAVQNLFYLNNVVHDVLYRHGFNEAAGNFQVNNFGKGGLGNDSVNAEAQDGSGTDNANFSTPVDGSAPRMQMYLWTGSAPNGIVTVGASSYGAYGSTFGAALTTTGINGATALYNDGTGTTSDGCEASTTALTGKIALVDRGTCNFTVKVLNAQNAGAVGVIIVNNTGTDEAFAPSGTDRKVKIPSAMVSLNSGAALRMAVGSAANLRKSGAVALQIDGDIDSDVVFHEYGHGLTWRMIGGMSGKLAGAIGEGASDVVAFLLNGDDRIGEYAASTPAGIRRQPYSTYVGTYSTVTGAEVHNDGEIYAATMWDLWQRYAQADVSTDTLLDDFVGGMNYTPATPAFENMRDGMLQQAAGTGRECLIWRAFANRGIGVGAKATISRRGALTITQSFTLPASCP